MNGARYRNVLVEDARIGDLGRMTRLFAFLLLPIALLVACDGGEGKDPAKSGDFDLKKAEIVALFAGKTVKGHHERKHYDFESYYEPTGSLRSYQGSDRKRREATWTVKNDEICITWQDDPEELCRKMVKAADGSYRKEKVKKNGDRLVVVTFESFTDGNPNKL